MIAKISMTLFVVAVTVFAIMFTQTVTSHHNALVALAERVSWLETCNQELLNERSSKSLDDKMMEMEIKRLGRLCNANAKLVHHLYQHLELDERDLLFGPPVPRKPEGCGVPVPNDDDVTLLTPEL